MTDHTHENGCGCSGHAEHGKGTCDHNHEIDFATFVFSLGTAAMVYLGDYEDKNMGKQEPDYKLAKQHIDILGLLADKTKGNLTGDEDMLLNSLLRDLRLRYVEKTKDKK